MYVLTYLYGRTEKHIAVTLLQIELLVYSYLNSWCCLKKASRMTSIIQHPPSRNAERKSFSLHIRLFTYFIHRPFLSQTSFPQETGRRNKTETKWSTRTSSIHVFGRSGSKFAACNLYWGEMREATFMNKSIANRPTCVECPANV